MPDDNPVEDEMLHVCLTDGSGKTTRSQMAIKDMVVTYTIADQEVKREDFVAFQLMAIAVNTQMFSCQLAANPLAGLLGASNEMMEALGRDVGFYVGGKMAEADAKRDPLMPDQPMSEEEIEELCDTPTSETD